MVANNEINQDLKVVSGALSDVEMLDLPWNEFEIASLSIEWPDICGRARNLIENESRLINEQWERFHDLKNRFKIVNEKLKELNLENPFEQE